MAQAGTPTPTQRGLSAAAAGPQRGSKRWQAAGRGEAWAALDLEMSEAKFQRLVLELAAWTGWHNRYHTYRSDKSEPGFPDLVLVRRERIVFAELKTHKGKTSAEQRSWLDALRYAHPDTYLWTPADWPEVRATLK